MTTEQYSMGYQAGHSDGWNAATDNFFTPPAPDCRTCDKYDARGNAMGHKCVQTCTNGDQYQPAPAVVLWRTE